MVSRAASMLMGAAGVFLAAFLRDRRFFLPALRLVVFFLIFLLAFFLAGLLLAAFFLVFFLAFFFLAFFLAVFLLVAFFLVPTLRFFATRFLAMRFFVVFFFAAFLFVRFFAGVRREDFFFARAFDFLRVALANGHLLKAYAFAGERRSRDALYELNT